ncbi:MAG: hypothetical protein U1E45_05605 [Geminicoccaceae bacterium]
MPPQVENAEGAAMGNKPQSPPDQSPEVAGGKPLDAGRRTLIGRLGKAAAVPAVIAAVSGKPTPATAY